MGLFRAVVETANQMPSLNRKTRQTLLAILVAVPVLWTLIFAYRAAIDAAKLDYRNVNYLRLSVARETLRGEFRATYQVLEQAVTHPGIIDVLEKGEKSPHFKAVAENLKLLDTETQLLAVYIVAHDASGPGRVILNHERTSHLHGGIEHDVWLDRTYVEENKALKRSVREVQTLLRTPAWGEKRIRGLSGESFQAAHCFRKRYEDAFLYALPIYDQQGRLRGQAAGVFWCETFRKSVASLGAAALVVPRTGLCVYSAHFLPEAPEYETVQFLIPYFRESDKPPDLLFSENISLWTGDAGGRWEIVAAKPDFSFHDGSQARNARYSLALGVTTTLVLVFLFQLFIVKEAAVASQRSKSQFLAQMSHEIRTPINGILGMTRLALKTELSPAQTEYLEAVHHSATSLLGIINDILDFSKIEAGAVSYSEAETDVLEVAHGCLKTVATRVGEKTVELLFETEGSVPPKVMLDPDRLRQVLLNLLSNATKFTHEGSVLLRIKSDFGGGLEFSVIDTGIGIAGDKLQRVFESFAQADEHTTRDYGGTGLGLAISTKLVERMGGRLQVESELGKGSRFFFTIEPEIVVDTDPQPLPLVPIILWCSNSILSSSLQNVITQWGLQCNRAFTRDEFDGFRLTLPQHKVIVDHQFISEKLLKDLNDVDPIYLVNPDQLAQVQQLLEGERFVIKPVHPDKLAALLRGEQIQTAKAPKEIQAPKEHRGMKVLVAEDNPINQTLVQILLSDLGHEVTIASDGVEAVAKVKSDDWDLVLMDVQMPELGGLDATVQIRKWEESTSRPRVPIIALTAQALQGDRERCLEVGMDGYLSKPIDEDELERELARLGNP